MKNLSWFNITVISDGFNGSYWNDGYSTEPVVAVDVNGTEIGWKIFVF